MEAKKNLNNTQRKMLDEIYTSQFKKKEQVILKRRDEGMGVLQRAVLKKALTNKQLSPMINSLRKFRELYKTNKEYMDENGFHLTQMYDIGNVKLEVNYKKYGELGNPELNAYHDETERIRDELETKRREMRARIYGLNVTYEEADKEIYALLESIKV